MPYQIGTEEPRGIVGSRRAKDNSLISALNECRKRSLYFYVQKAWLREVMPDGKLGPVLATFVRGRHQKED